MDDGTIDLFDEWRNPEDFTGAVCWLIWDQKRKTYDTREALVDAEDFDLLKHLPWRIQKIGKNRKPRVTRANHGNPVYLARELMGHPAGRIVDHENRNSLDDRRRNLRICTVRENNLNSTGSSKGTSRFKGVAWTTKRGKWTVFAGKKGERVFVGAFDSEVAAARAYNEFARKHYGPFAYLNPV